MNLKKGKTANAALRPFASLSMIPKSVFGQNFMLTDNQRTIYEYDYVRVYGFACFSMCTSVCTCMSFDRPDVCLFNV